ncbi:UNVERIFIED_CONTAM: hypothetical protein GTU68_017558 [Idotea baltica]|nr:hypothetical protein [Idotea baltica]
MISIQDKVLILDFGSQYTQLIARRVRELHIYCEIHPFNTDVSTLGLFKAVILSGSPCSVNDDSRIDVDLSAIFALGPVLGVCYGAQYIADTNNGKVAKSQKREYGKASLLPISNDPLWKGINDQSQVWMSHADTILALGEGFEIIGSTYNIPIAGYKYTNSEFPVYGIQFHPEVTHSLDGLTILQNFLVDIAGCSQDWTPASFIEKKRKAIGKTFIDVFLAEAEKEKDIKWLAQGTIYPDVIESVSVNGPSATIKSHHNVGGLPDYLDLELLEPLRMLFKDEVRRLGNALELPSAFVQRHPFPGPGLAIRVLGEITEEKVRLCQEADAIYINLLKKHGWYDKIWQAGAILLPVKSVGVMGDERTYEFTCALRAVNSTDGMTAEWSQIPYELLAIISNEIINSVKGINRVVYDISTKPPATIEWE